MKYRVVEVGLDKPLRVPAKYLVKGKIETLEEARMVRDGPVRVDKLGGLHYREKGDHRVRAVEVDDG